MRCCPLLSALVLVSGVCRGQDLAELELDHNVRSEFVTPHTDWAVPYARGKTRALFFVRGHGTEPRHVIELEQRFDLDAQVVFWNRVIDSTHEDWHGADRGVQRMARLLEQKWDVFVFLSPGAARNVTPDMMPTEQQYRMLRAVADGAGLVLVGADDPRVLKKKNQLRDLPPALAEVDRAAAFKVKQGRGVRLPKATTIEYRRGWEADYDQWAMRVGKAILWAAGKEPTVQLELRPKSAELAREALPAAAATIAWNGATGGTAEVKLRRDDGEVIQTQRFPLDGANGTRVMDMPRVRAGQYFFDVVARNGDRVAGFTSAAINVKSGATIERLSLDQDWAETGQRLSGKFGVAGVSGEGRQAVVRLQDHRGRRLVEQTVPVHGGGCRFSFEVHAWYPMLLEVRATLMDGGDEVASAWQWARVVKRHQGQFNFVMWDTPRGNLAPFAEEALARTGVTIHLAHSTPQTYLGAFEMAWIPYTTHIAATRDERGVMKPACWADEAAIQKHVDAIVAKHIPARQHGVFAYSLGDEIAVRGSCLSPQCLEAYRRYLRGEYKEISALNASWGSRYGSFDEVQLSKADDNDEAEALKAGNFPRWFDRQAYQSHNFCQLCARFGRGFRGIDPQSRCGFEGAGTFARGDDLDGFVRANSFWSPYPGTADEVLRSIAPRDFPRANWMGYTKDADSLLDRYWRMITRGCDAVWWWRWDALGRFHGWLAPTLDPFPAVADILRDTQIVRDGLGDLLLASVMQTDGVGVLYCQAAAYAAKVPVSSSFGSYEGNHAAAHHALRELGLNFQYFTDRQMRLGEVDLGKFKVIFLPMTQALGAAEVEMLRGYVRNGGTLVADVRPAIYDGHVKPMTVGQLDDVFGVQRTGLDAAQLTAGTVQVSAAPKKSESLELGKVRIDPGVQAAQAVASGSAGKVPLFLSNRFGKGRALLLNLTMSSFPSLAADAPPEAAAELLRGVLNEAGVSAAFRLVRDNGPRLRNVEVTRWTSGPVEIVSLLRQHGQAEPGRLELGREMYVYELKGGKSLGRQKAVMVTLTPSRAVFYALSPQTISAVELKAAAELKRGSLQTIRVASRLSEGRQAVRVEVILPDGTVADWGRRVVVVDRAGSNVDVPLAYNDPAGTWTVRATELYTRAVTEARFTVR